MLKEKVLEQINHLIESGEILRRGNSNWQTLSQEHEQKCDWFLWRVSSFISQYLKSSNWYHISITKILNQWRWFNIPQSVGSLVETLKWLKTDIENWFLKWLESQLSAEIFDNFLDHGALYLKEWHKNEAGVIIGITFEDSIRKLARLLDISENWMKMDELIVQLQKIDTFSWTEAKGARYAAAVRTSAAHARWEELTESNVEACLKFTKELIWKIDNLR